MEKNKDKECVRIIENKLLLKDTFLYNYGDKDGNGYFFDWSSRNDWDNNHCDNRCGKNLPSKIIIISY